MSKLGMREMLEAGAHFGHQTRRWNPKMSKYIFGPRNGIHIIDLQQTVPLLKQAYTFVVNLVANGGKVLFVGTKKQAQDIIAEEAKRAGQHYVNNRWLGGMLTNFKTVKQSVDRMRSIEEMSKDGTFEKLPKKEVINLSRELGKLEKNLLGVKDMGKLPGAVFIIDPNLEYIAVCEARKLGIPVVATVDTNCDPDVIDHPIPANDDSIRAVKLFVSSVADACLEGAAQYQERLAEKRAKGDIADEEAPSEANGAKQHTKKGKRKQPQVDVIHNVVEHVKNGNGALLDSDELAPDMDDDDGADLKLSSSHHA